MLKTHHNLPDRIKVTKPQAYDWPKRDSKERMEMFQRIEEAGKATYGIAVNSFDGLEPEYVEEFAKAKDKNIKLGPHPSLSLSLSLSLSFVTCCNKEEGALSSPVLSRPHINPNTNTAAPPQLTTAPPQLGHRPPQTHREPPPLVSCCQPTTPYFRHLFRKSITTTVSIVVTTEYHPTPLSTHHPPPSNAHHRHHRHCCEIPTTTKLLLSPIHFLVEFEKKRSSRRPPEQPPVAHHHRLPFYHRLLLLPPTIFSYHHCSLPLPSVSQLHPRNFDCVFCASDRTSGIDLHTYPLCRPSLSTQHQDSQIGPYETAGAKDVKATVNLQLNVHVVVEIEFASFLEVMLAVANSYKE
ncbi:unnamed protein product [Lactuca virosa]|uniref:Uncharacterized protein n=1 Tax=Lactuca virosa TaxID=75947 RepID=A0AAU9LJZ6_9ASTR|nr:unnamed protein product [Lactuca virosa]